jgi:hypothetical protein
VIKSDSPFIKVGKLTFICHTKTGPQLYQKSIGKANEVG